MTQTATPLIGNQATVKIGNQGGSPTYVPVIGLTKITPPKPKYGTAKTTTIATGFEKVTKTIPDYGEFTIEGLYESADPGQLALAAAFAVGSNSTNGGDFPFEITLAPDLAGGQTTTGDMTAFSGPVTEFYTGDIEADKPLTFTCTVKVNSAPVVTEGS